MVCASLSFILLEVYVVGLRRRQRGKIPFGQVPRINYIALQEAHEIFGNVSTFNAPPKACHKVSW